ncbi:MAG: tyrosine-protein phosphatase, partial [Actinomycetota bacterium]|nr:tyrosine-protein phosphatase [Actinomycetota bacterium]
ATMRAVLGMLTDPATYPVAYHCFAGKDRTGILSAVVLELLGVSDEDIIADYALSREGMDRMLAWLRERNPDRAEEIDASASAIAAAEPASMAAFLEGLRSEHGSAEGYAESLGLAGIGERVRGVLLER